MRHLVRARMRAYLQGGGEETQITKLILLGASLAFEPTHGQAREMRALPWLALLWC